MAFVVFVFCVSGCASSSDSTDTGSSGGTGSSSSGSVTTPATPTFTDNLNGTIAATATTTTGGLTWMKCVQGQTYNSGPNTCTGAASTFQYCSLDDQSCNDSTTKRLNGTGTSAAYTTCNTLNSTPPGGFAGKTTWRVPKKEELKSLVVCSNGPSAPLADNVACNSGSTLPTMNTTVFPSVTAVGFWSATESVSAGFANYTCLGSNCFGAVAGVTSSNNNSAANPVRCVAD
jgi:hypothetical protein